MKATRKPEGDALIIDARLLLTYDTASRVSYASIGVPGKDVQARPFYEWLGKLMKVDIEGASELQVVRDARLTEKLFAKDSSVKERGTLDLAHLFVEAKSQLFIVSHETPDALDALVARMGLPEKVGKIPLCGAEQRHEAIAQVLELPSVEFVFVYELGLTPRQEKRIVEEVLRGRGVLVNNPAISPRTFKIDEQVFDLVEKRWGI